MTVDRETERQDDSAIVQRESQSTRAHVRVLLGGIGQAVYEIDRKGLAIGRDGSSPGMLVTSDARTSRNHARIECGATGWSFVDQGSRNGGFVMGVPCAPKQRIALVDGAVIRVGDTIMVFRASPATDDGARDESSFPGISPVAQAIRARIRTLALAPGHALVLGETGAGKERAARALAHPGSARPFVTLNCAELTRDLARSELFGHARGAFSGALTAKQGLVDLAGDGTLFLDEVGELPLDVQGELLRFLEDGSYRAVGANELRRSVARVIAATNVDLDKAIDAGRFRRDLRARLRASNMPLELPPLRERCEDIPQWTRMFSAEAGSSAELGPGALECLLVYLWPENLRELRATVRDLPAGVATAEHLPAKVRAHRAALRSQTRETDEPARVDPTRDEIESALARAQGVMRTAAIDLRIDRRKLYRLCERYSIVLDAHRNASDD
jgi:DNA-binding NtrC family response regulator